MANLCQRTPSLRQLLRKLRFQREAMTSAEYLVRLAPESSTQAVMFVVVANRGGLPLANVHVRFRLEGDGTFHSSFEEKSAEETTSEDGEAYVTWWEYPLY